MNIENLSTTYTVRKIEDEDIESVYSLCKENTTYYEYCPPFVSIEGIKTDMEILPPGKTIDDKYYIGFWNNTELITVMDLIDGYPNDKTAYIGFFMMNKKWQKQGIGSQIIKEALTQLKAWGFAAVKLGYVKGNRQSETFWLKNGFLQAGSEIVQELYTVIPMKLKL